MMPSIMGLPTREGNTARGRTSPPIPTLYIQLQRSFWSIPAKTPTTTEGKQNQHGTYHCHIRREARTPHQACHGTQEGVKGCQAPHPDTAHEVNQLLLCSAASPRRTSPWKRTSDDAKNHRVRANNKKTDHGVSVHSTEHHPRCNC